MNKKTVYFLKGLPASGKSTIAKKMVEDSQGTLKRVNKDEIRLMMDSGKWSKEREKYVSSVHNMLMEDYLKNGYSVISDNTNFANCHYEFAKELAKKYDAEFVVKHIDTPILECIRRDATRQNAVGEQVIYRMWNQYVRPTENPSNSLKDKAAIFDIDGTLANHKNRSPFAWDKVLEDEINIPVFEVYNALKDFGYKIIIFTGRDGSCEEDTKKWLKQNNIEYDLFDIRPEGNTEKDSIIKFRMFEKIKDKYNVVLCIDDREQVVEMYRDIGIPTFQVDYGKF